MRAWRQWLVECYLTADRRSLGAFRIGFALVLLSDLVRRWAEIRFWYVNSGLLPNHTLLWRPPAGRLFSLFFTVSNEGEAHVAFALCALIYLAFLLGYRTGWAQALTLVARVSLNSRLAALENGGDMVMDLLCVLTLPLPLGARFSLDAVGRALHAPEEHGSPRPVVSVAFFGLLLQFAAIYLFNAASKNGQAWRDGTAIHYALHQDKFVTWFGVWMRERIPSALLAQLGRAVIATEWLGWILILTPVYRQQARLIAVCVMPLLHLGFALGLNLGGFSVAMMSFYPLLLTSQHWDAASRRFGSLVRPKSDRVEALARRLLSKFRYPLSAPRSMHWQAFLEAACILTLVAIATEVLNDNAPVPQALRIPQPAWAKAVIEYPRILQGWRMFAPEPSRQDSMIYVDAKTATGRRVDPYNEVASEQHYPAADVVPKHMGQSQFFTMYSDRIPNVNYAAYRQAFSEWLIAYPERTGRAQDCLVSYEVYYVTDQTPPPGSSAPPKPAERQLFMTYVAPYDSPCRTLQASTSARSPSAG